MLRRAAGTEVRWDARGVDLQPQLILVNPALGALRGQLSTAGQVRLGGGGLAALTGTLSLDWKGALLAGRAVDHLVIRGSAEPGTVRVETAEGRVGPNEIQLSQVTLPAAPLFEGRWRALLAAASGTFTASLGDVPAFLALWGVEALASAAAVPDHRLRLEGSLEKGTIRLARGDLAAGPGKAALEALVVTFPREDQGWGETAFSGGATVDIPDLRELSALFPMPPLSGSLRGEISGAGTFARPEGRASLTGRRIEVAGKKLGDVELRAHGAAGEIEVDTLAVARGATASPRGLRFAPAALAAPGPQRSLRQPRGSFASAPPTSPDWRPSRESRPNRWPGSSGAPAYAGGNGAGQGDRGRRGLLRRRGRLDHPARARVACPVPGRTGRRTRHSRAIWRWTSPTSGRSRRSFTSPRCGEPSRERPGSPGAHRRRKAPSRPPAGGSPSAAAGSATSFSRGRLSDNGW